jgi:hypothetical protein
MEHVYGAKKWDCVQAITILYINTPFYYEQLKVVTLPCLLSSLPLLCLTASPWVKVAAGGCYKVHVQGPYSFSEADGQNTIVTARLNVNFQRV